MPCHLQTSLRPRFDLVAGLSLTAAEFRELVQGRAAFVTAALAITQEKPLSGSCGRGQKQAKV